MRDQKSAEVILGLSPQTEGLNMRNRLETELSMTTAVAAGSVEIQTLTSGKCEQNSCRLADEATNVTAGEEILHDEHRDLLLVVLDRQNMQKAYSRVMRNKGAAGVDGLGVGELKADLQAHWPEYKAALLDGEYRPSPVRKVEIPKPGGGMRQLGIPTVLDRLIQQALHQVLSPVFDPGFSEYSYGFRPRRSAGQAVRQARDYVEAGYRWVVDIDLEKFFDRVNHDILISRLSHKVKDKRVLKLIRAYLESGMIADGIETARKQGTPQGGPLSPLLSNILLNDLDTELERRGHKFCRYADDCNIYVKSKRAGQRVQASITRFLKDILKLKVNQEKSGVDRPWKRKFLGYTVCGRKYSVRLKVAPQVVIRFMRDIKGVFRRGRGGNLCRIVDELNPKLRGWMIYFRYIGVKGLLQKLDGWIRRHLRKILWLQWKRPATRAKRLMRLGLGEKRACMSAGNGRGAWWNSGASHMNQALPKNCFDRLGLVSLVDYNHQLKCCS